MTWMTDVTGDFKKMKGLEVQRIIAVTGESQVALPYIAIRLKCSQLAFCRLEYEARQQGAITARVEPGDSQPAKYLLQGPKVP